MIRRPPRSTRTDTLFPYTTRFRSGSPIWSQTVATGHAAGWFWDIGLPERRGIGCVYASRFLDDEAAEARLRSYIAAALPDAPAVAVRKPGLPTAPRARFWQGNCVAVRQAAGFSEPGETSAQVEQGRASGRRGGWQ